MKDYVVWQKNIYLSIDRLEYFKQIEDFLDSVSQYN
jgi:hypothetical protein